jgi:hypothetical protein
MGFLDDLGKFREVGLEPLLEPPRAAFGPGLSAQLSLADPRACVHPVCDREGGDAFAAFTPLPPAPGSHPPK